MRITYISLTGYQKLHSIGSSVTIDLYKNKFKDIVFLGRNGIGKSTILTELTPFNTRPLAVNGHSSKLLEYQLQDDEFFLVEHQVGKTAKSFVYAYSLKERKRCLKSLEYRKQFNMNPRGSAGTFAQLIYEKFGLLPKYLELANLGNDIDSFIMAPSTERKNFLSAFLPDTKIWSEYSAAVRAAINQLKAHKKIMLDEISNVDKESLLNIDEKQLQKRLAKSKEKIAEYTTKIGVFNERTSNIETSTQSLFSTIDAGKITEFLSQYKSITHTNAAIIKDKLSAKLLESEMVIQQTEKNAAVLIAEIDSIKQVGNEKETLLKKKQALLDDKLHHLKQLSTFYRELDSNIETDIEKLKALIKDNTAKIATEKKKLKGLTHDCNKLLELEKTEVTSTLDFFERFKELEESCKNIRLQLELHSFSTIPDIRDIENSLITKRKSVAALENKAKEMVRKVAYADGQRHALVEGKAIVTEVFQKHHKYEEVAARFDSKIKSSGHSSAFSQENVAEQKQQLEQLEQLGRVVSMSKVSLDAEIRRLRGIIERCPIINVLAKVDFLANTDSFINFILRNSVDELIKMFDVSDKQDILNTINSIHTLDEANAARLERLANLEEKLAEKSNMEKIAETITETKLAIKELRQEVKVIDTEIDELFAKMEVLDAELMAITTVDTLRALIEQIGACISTYQRNLKRIVGNNDKIKNLTQYIHKHELLMASYQEKIASATAMNKLAAINDQLIKLESIADAVHPVKGLPLSDLKVFITFIEETVNRIILDNDVLTNTSITLELVDDCFNINITNSHGDTFDVNKASSGQRSLIRLIISLAVMKYTIGPTYNILTVDELDAVLDREKNKFNFKVILDSATRLLNTEQIFHVTHNDAIINADVCLVLFPGHSFDEETRNKYVIDLSHSKKQ